MKAFEHSGKKILSITAVVVVTAIVICAVAAEEYFNKLNDYRQKAAAISIDEVALKTIDDGVYEGQYDIGFVAAKVRLTVENHEIKDIQILRHVNGRGSSAEVIINDMVKQQKIDVDAVSGATNSSKVIKKACEEALKGN